MPYYITSIIISIAFVSLLFIYHKPEIYVASGAEIGVEKASIVYSYYKYLVSEGIYAPLRLSISPNTIGNIKDQSFFWRPDASDSSQITTACEHRQDGSGVNFYFDRTSLDWEKPDLKNDLMYCLITYAYEVNNEIYNKNKVSQEVEVFLGDKSNIWVSSN